jgi:hypothetical protein
MRLLNTQSLELSRPYVPREVPDYAILSHRWDTEEVTFADISNASILELHSRLRAKTGFAKIQGACQLAYKDGYEWIWIDSCCIDKSSSAELQEAINSMWGYYARSNICYVYLTDVPDLEAGWGAMFAESEWFTRGWTLQELIAPACVEFYAKDWVPIGTKFERYDEIAEITSIRPDVLMRARHVGLFSTAERLSWAAHRNVTREEDKAYSLLGLFDVNMPLLYGEGGGKAFARLQEAIYNATVDQSIFLFHYGRQGLDKGAQPLLASSPTSFCNRVNCNSCRSQGKWNTPSELSYHNCIRSEIWSTQAHEQITTTVTNSYNETSTTLLLLAYEDVSSKLEFFEEISPQVRITHVAILNYTLKKYPEGAFCLLLSRGSVRSAACTRLYVHPAVLPHFVGLDPLQRTRILISSRSSSSESVMNLVAVTFCVESDLFHVETWDVESGSSSHPILSAQQYPEFKIQMEGPEYPRRPVLVSCRISDVQYSKLSLGIQLVQMHDIWSIKEIFEQKEGSRECRIRPLFNSNILADRASFPYLNGETLSVKLRRLPGSARTGGEGNIVRKRYVISVDYL